MSCVNAVGVELNTASAALLTYVSGLGPALAGKIVAWRDEHGPFPSRVALKEVPRLGVKAFVQAAGFLRIRDGENPLDASAVHPESYEIVDRMAGDLSCSIVDLMRDEALRKQIDPTRYVTDEVGLPTLNDILAELARPGRDPRERFETFRFADGIEKMEDLTPGMKLPGIVTNLTAFGAFVDIGVHQDGLVHLSQIADRFVKNPGDVLKVRQTVEVTVLAVDLERKRISLTLKKQPAAGEKSGTPRRERGNREGELAGEPSRPKAAADARREKTGGMKTPEDGSVQGGPPRKHSAPGGKPGEKRAPGEGASGNSAPGGPPQKRTSPEGSSPETPADRPIRPRQGQERPDRARPQRIKPRDEKVPFNNPFAAVFGKKR